MSRNKRDQILGRIVLGLALLGILHFIISLLIWATFGFAMPFWVSRATDVDWGMFLHSIPALALLLLFVMSFVFGLGKKIRRAGAILSAALVVSAVCFSIETGKNLYQVLLPISHTQFEYRFYSWWWYRKTVRHESYNYRDAYINKTGAKIFESEFDYTHGFSEGLALVKLKKMWGFMNELGECVIKPQFDFASSFSEELAVVRIDQKAGYINKTGEYAIKPQFDNAGDFSEGFAPVKIKEKWGYIDKAGAIAIKPRFDFAEGFSEGLAPISVDQKYGFIDTTGTFVIQARFDGAKPFSGGMAPVEFEGKWGYVDKTGRIVIAPEYDVAHRFSDGIALVQKDNAKSGYRHGHITQYLNKHGDPLLEAPLDSALDFAEGFAPVRIGKQWGFIDHTGKVSISPQFDLALAFSEGMASVAVGDKWGYINKTGKLVIHPQFDSASWFSEGLARVGMIKQTNLSGDYSERGPDSAGP